MFNTEIDEMIETMVEDTPCNLECAINCNERKRSECKQHERNNLIRLCNLVKEMK